MEKILKDTWKSGNPYDLFMGRWSRLVARSFVAWLSPSSGLKWLDVGCGSGALSEMKRVTISGGTVAIYVWDYAGKMDFLTKFWDAVSELDEKNHIYTKVNDFRIQMQKSNGLGIINWIEMLFVH